MARSVAIVGAGIAGLTVGYELMQRAERLGEPLDLRVLEANDRPGGNIRTDAEQGFLYEWGATGFLDSAPASVTLVRRLGLEPRVLKARDEAARRFIYRKGKLRELPLGPASFLGSGVLSPLGKLRLLAEPLIPARRERSTESVFDFAARRIGREAASVLVDAMVSGVYAGDARRLELETTFAKMHAMESEHGGLFRAMLAKKRASKGAEGDGGGPAGPAGRLTSFQNGLQELIDALAAALGPRRQRSTPILRISDMATRGFRLHPREGAPLDVDAVVVACPAWHAAKLLHTVDAELGGALDGIPAAPVAVVHQGFREDPVGRRPAGFGLLVPRGQGARILGVLWPTNIYGGRSPDGSFLATVMVGGAHDPEALELDDEALRRLVRQDLSTILGIEAKPWFERILRYRQGIPQYTLGHRERLATIEARCARLPGLQLAGNSLHGVAINACVEGAPAVAESILDHLAGERAATG
jgi:oxygen-dependent protoporphyrinogen oxidase